jgi:PhzF family phenazine biosynthesis protein
MRIRYFHVDAFTGRVFGGNPAGVCPLENWLEDSVLQKIAAENNLSETAFFVREPDGYHLRWFTPTIEVDLCGHATLATAYVLFTELNERGDTIQFRSESGILATRRRGDLIELDFPSWPPVPCVAPPLLVDALGAAPLEVLQSRDYVAVFESEEAIAALAPDMALLTRLDRIAVTVTAPGSDADFVSRFFAPRAGIPEDPVTGSAHCSLIPYWAQRLGKTELFARQISRRGGELYCRDAGERVLIGGRAVMYSRGEIGI